MFWAWGLVHLGPEDWQPKASHHAPWGTQCAAASDEGTKAGNSHSTWCVEHDHFMINIYIIYIYINISHKWCYDHVMKICCLELVDLVAFSEIPVFIAAAWLRVSHECHGRRDDLLGVFLWEAGADSGKSTSEFGDTGGNMPCGSMWCKDVLKAGTINIINQLTVFKKNSQVLLNRLMEYT